MKHVCVLQHNPEVPIGHLGDALAEAGLDVDLVDLAAGDPLPADPGVYAALISLGGFMGAYDEQEYPWLAAEKRLLSTAVGRGIPVLGVCLGCQVLADALGGDAFAAPALEAGLLDVEVVADDPVLRHLDRPVVVWHGDTWTLPPGATLLARTADAPHAFRAGSGLGIQAHPEATPAILAGWMDEKGRTKLERAGIDPEQFLGSVETRRDELKDMARRLFGAWTAEVAGPG